MIDISKNLIGFDHNLNIIKNNFNNKSLPNSLIFYGNKGIGKITFCYSLINNLFNELNKENSNINHTNLIYNNSHPNLRILKSEFDEKIKKSKNYITVDQIREIGLFLNQSSINNIPKFIVIDSSDDLNTFSANALLKKLEEPKVNTYFFLISHQISSLLPTIRSRCIKFKFPNLTFQQFNKILSQNHDSIDTSIINFLYDFSKGSPGLALKYYFENINEIFYLLIKIFEEKKPLSSNILELSNNVGEFNNEQFKIFLTLIRFILINTTKINLGINIKQLFVSDVSKSLNHLSKYLNNKLSLNILEYLNINENDLFTFNLDKKIFSLNIFSSISKI